MIIRQKIVTKQVYTINEIVNGPQTVMIKNTNLLTSKKTTRIYLKYTKFSLR